MGFEWEVGQTDLLEQIQIQIEICLDSQSSTVLSHCMLIMFHLVSGLYSNEQIIICAHAHYPSYCLFQGRVSKQVLQWTRSQICPIWLCPATVRLWTRWTAVIWGLCNLTVTRSVWFKDVDFSPCCRFLPSRRYFILFKTTGCTNAFNRNIHIKLIWIISTSSDKQMLFLTSTVNSFGVSHHTHSSETFFRLLIYFRF